MGGHGSKKAVCLQPHIGIISRHFEGAAFLILRCVYRSLRINMTGNNSGALLLTIKRLTSWRGYALQRRIYFYGALRRALG
jgi:hypothetical protein